MVGRPANRGVRKLRGRHEAEKLGGPEGSNNTSHSGKLDFKTSSKGKLIKLLSLLTFFIPFLGEKKTNYKRLHGFVNEKEAGVEQKTHSSCSGRHSMLATTGKVEFSLSRHWIMERMRMEFFRERNSCRLFFPDRRGSKEHLLAILLPKWNPFTKLEAPEQEE